MVWSKMVDCVLGHTERVKFNILYTGEDLESFINMLGYCFTIEKPTRKFYLSGNVLSIELSDCEEVTLLHLKDFNYWKNKSIEDPSFWKGDEELLACITHENMVMIDEAYFADMVRDLTLYDLSD